MEKFTKEPMHMENVGRHEARVWTTLTGELIASFERKEDAQLFLAGTDMYEALHNARNFFATVCHIDSIAQTVLDEMTAALSKASGEV